MRPSRVSTTEMRWCAAPPSGPRRALPSRIICASSRPPAWPRRPRPPWWRNGPRPSPTRRWRCDLHAARGAAGRRDHAPFRFVDGFAHVSAELQGGARDLEPVLAGEVVGLQVARHAAIFERKAVGVPKVDRLGPAMVDDVGDLDTPRAELVVLLGERTF